MSLYDDVEDDPGFKKKNKLRLREKATIAPVIDLSGDKRRKNVETIIPVVSVKTVTESAPKIVETINEKFMQSGDDTQVQSIYSSTEEEYDPFKPNDYEKLVDDLKKRKLYVSPHQTIQETSQDNPQKQSKSRSNSESRYSKSLSNRHQDEHRHGYSHGSNGSAKKDSSLRPRYADEDYDRDLSAAKRTSVGATFAPPPALIEESKKSDNEEYESPFQNTSKSAPSTPRSAVEKMMEKMGYREGEGLGRNKQGMSVALQVEKIGKRAGRIIHEKDLQKDNVPPTIEPMRNPSKVILLRNMVGPGEVDGELEGETKDECQKYGEVNKVVIFEIPDTIPEEAVRIFIEFKTQPAAIKALVDLNGRFFGGRIVKATFYNLDKFRSYNLADEP